MLINKFYQDLVIRFNTFCTQDFLETLEEECCNLLTLLSFDGEVNDCTSGVEGLKDFVLIVAGEDESAVTSKLLNKRP